MAKNFLEKRVEFLSRAVDGYKRLIAAGITGDEWINWCQRELGIEDPDSYHRTASYVQLDLETKNVIVVYPEDHYLAGTAGVVGPIKSSKQ